MNLKDIKPVATPKSIRDQYGVHVFRGQTPVYTAGQMQEYAKSKVAEAFEIYDVDLHDEVLEELFEEKQDD